MSYRTKKHAQIFIGTHNGPKHSADEFLTLAIELLYYEKNEQQVIVYFSDEWDLQKESTKFPSEEFDAMESFDEKEQSPATGQSYWRRAWHSFGHALCSSSAVFAAFEKQLIQQFELFEQSPLAKALAASGVACSWTVPHGLTRNEIRTEFRSRLDDLAGQLQQYIAALESTQALIQPEEPVAAPEIVAVPVDVPQTEIKTIVVHSPDDPFEVMANGQIAILYKHGKVDEVIAKLPDLYFIIYPQNEEETLWGVRALKTEFPRAWRAADKDTLQKLTGVSDVVSCQDGGKVAKAKSGIGGLRIAEAALLAA